MSTLDDGDAVTDINTLVTGYQTDVNAVAVSRVRRYAFNRFHSRSVISVDTPASPKVSSTESATNYDGGTYTFSAAWTALGWLSISADGGSDTTANRGTGNWSIVGHEVSLPDAAITAEIALGGNIEVGMANAVNPEDGCAGFLVLGNVELRSYDDTGAVTDPDLHLHLCIQVEENGTWHTIESSNRAWSLNEFDGDGQAESINVDLSVRTLITESVLTAEVGDTDLSGIRMMIAMSNAGASLTSDHYNVNVTLGGFNLTAIGLYAGDPA